MVILLWQTMDCDFQIGTTQEVADIEDFAL